MQLYKGPIFRELGIQDLILNTNINELLVNDCLIGISVMKASPVVIAIDIDIDTFLDVTWNQEISFTSLRSKCYKTFSWERSLQ